MREISAENDELHSPWIIPLLVNLLYDPSAEISTAAINFLMKKCESHRNVKILIECKPDLENIREDCRQLFLHLLALPEGLNYLIEIGFAENELERWTQHFNEQYVAKVENIIAIRNAGRSFHQNIDCLDQEWPVHFFAELVKTKQGAEYLFKTKKMDNLVKSLDEFLITERNDTKNLLLIKSILWAIGNVATSSHGVQLLQEFDVLKRIVQIGTESQIFSIKGYLKHSIRRTCFYVLNLFARTEVGSYLLKDIGWSTVNRLESSTGPCIALPDDLIGFFRIEKWHYCSNDTVPPTLSLSDNVEKVLFL